ncbi:hypothetical protein MalM25_09320 [Planctomycetes bacterium MalM25]|nr:hypothetical protein MalM25_09320 [Planctomycetes bacterium MalM25]
MPTNRVLNRWRIGLLCLVAGVPARGLASDASFPAGLSALLQTHCAACHTGEDAESGFELADAEAQAELAHSPDTLQSVIDAIDLAYMPPDDEPQPSAEERAALLEGLRRLLDASLQEAEHPRTPLRRMNRFQYDNAVRDLLDLKVVVYSLPERIARDHGYFDPASGRLPEKVGVGNRPLGKSQMIEPRLSGVAPFPQDLRAEHGFDNRGDHLTLSPLLMESFVALGRSIVESKDFNRKNVGVWDTLYAEPQEHADTVIEERLRPFLDRAFRRPVDEPTLARYVGYARSQLAAGKPFTDSMKDVTAAVLCSPRFLYLYDGATTGPAPEEMDAHELATRLSFFLWGSLPDEELLALADKGTLSQPEVLSAQFDRMLRHPKVKRFCDSFPTQWLQLEQTIAAVPDIERYRQFYFGGSGTEFRLSMHMALEPLLLFEAVLLEDRPITQLIDSDFTYRSDVLDRWYRGQSPDDLKGAHRHESRIPFNRLTVEDPRQGGVLTTAAVMTMTSAPDRTKPITRGAWVATVIFNTPPPPPPADVPPLPEEDEHAEAAQPEQALSLREKILQHQTRADCASCHQKIDPLGFALENYGPAGEWREAYRNGAPVDSSGVLFDRHEFDGIVEFKEAILKEHDRFATGFAKHLLSFALGREVGPADQSAIERIVSQAGQREHRLPEYLRQVVLSEPFRMKHQPAEPSEPVANLTPISNLKE